VHACTHLSNMSWVCTSGNVIGSTRMEAARPPTHPSPSPGRAIVYVQSKIDTFKYVPRIWTKCDRGARPRCRQSYSCDKTDLIDRVRGLPDSEALFPWGTLGGPCAALWVTLGRFLHALGLPGWPLGVTLGHLLALLVLQDFPWGALGPPYGSLWAAF